jgi:L-fuconolactonase
MVKSSGSIFADDKEFRRPSENGVMAALISRDSGSSEIDIVNMESWLSLVAEDPIEPNLPIIDAHHHCWHEPPFPQFDSYDVDALAADIIESGHNVVATVYIDARSNYRDDGPEHLRVVGETEFMAAAAENVQSRGHPYAGLCAGIVSRADLLQGARVAEVLDAHIAAAPDRFKGIRQRTAYDPHNPFNAEGPRMMSRTGFREGFAQLGPRGLSFDASLLHPQIPELTDVARFFPDTTIILDHIGTPMLHGQPPDRRKSITDEWSASLQELATCRNVVVKIGGMNMEHMGLSFMGQDQPPTSEMVAARQRDFVLRVIDLFGPQRVMFESNFPVDRHGISYGILWNGFKRIVREFTGTDKAALFGGTANKVYRLGLPL